MSLLDVLSASYMFFRGKLVLIVSLGMFSSNNQTIYESDQHDSDQITLINEEQFLEREIIQ